MSTVKLPWKTSLQRKFKLDIPTISNLENIHNNKKQAI